MTSVPAPLREAIARVNTLLDVMDIRLPVAFSVQQQTETAADLRAILAALPTDAVQPVGGVDREAVITGSGFQPGSGGFKIITVDGVSYNPRQIKNALALYATAPTAGSGWLPIEELTDAHRDGRFILAFVGSADGRWEHLNGRVFAINHHGKTSSDFDLGWSLYPGLGGIPDSWFTAWKPLDLPAAPTVDSAAISRARTGEGG